MSLGALADTLAFSPPVQPCAKVGVQTARDEDEEGFMRRTITLLCAFTIVSTVAMTAAQAATVRRYDGTTSQDKRLVFILRKADDGALNLKVVDVKRFVLTCEDYTTQRWGVTWFWGGRGLALDGRELNLYENDGQSAFAIQGRSGPTRDGNPAQVHSRVVDRRRAGASVHHRRSHVGRGARLPRTPVQARIGGDRYRAALPGHLTVAMRRLS